MGRRRGSAVASHMRDLVLDGRRSRAIVRDARRPATAGRRAGPPADAARAPAEAIAEKADELFREMDFGFLFDPTRKLFSIGFRVREGALDPSYYDLLASEARLASFLAIAKGDVAADHWFRLGRALTPVGRGSALISWSGSMFEYLMPALVMRAPRTACSSRPTGSSSPVRSGTRAELGVPWGISESGVQRPRPRADLSVLELRRARSRAEARAQRGRRRRPVRHGAGGDGRSEGGGRRTSPA